MSTITDPFGFRARHQNAKPRRSQKGVDDVSTPTTPFPSPPPPPPSSRSAPAPRIPEALPRRPKAGCQITHNSLRPRVAAADRLLSWDSPWSLAHREALATALPPTLVNSALTAVRSALAPATKTSYGGGILRFSQFCDEHGIREEERMPASYALLSAFIGTFKGRVAGSTVRGWMSGLRAWHLVNHAPWHGDDEWVKLARSAANKEGVTHKKAPRSPISLEHLTVLKAHLNLSLPFHAAVWAVATTTFFGCRRLGETTVLSRTTFSPSRHVLRSTSPNFRKQTSGCESVSFRIPWTKTTTHDGATVVLTARHDRLCPRDALRNHLGVNDTLPPSAPLFAFKENGGWSMMTRDRFLSFVFAIWKRAGLYHVSGHSFRIGGAVALLLAGVPPEVVAATGGWTSLAFLLYWRRVEEILPMCTSKAYTKTHFDSLAQIFENFRSKFQVVVPASLD
ncbi:hypothetical protein MD484_g9119, partial [Candolleomyces efflorescens]